MSSTAIPFYKSNSVDEIEFHKSEVEAIKTSNTATNKSFQRKFQNASTSTATFFKALSAEQAFTSALYNSFAFVFLIIGITLCGLLLVVLQAFVRSILWALLTGAFLFTYKRCITDFSRDRLKQIETKRSCLSVQLFLLPFQLIDSCSDYVWVICTNKFRHLIILFFTIILFKLLNSFYETFIIYLLNLLNRLTSIITFFAFYIDNNPIISYTILIAYLISIVFCWKNEYRLFYRIISVPIWCCFLILISRFLGAYRMFSLIAFFFLTCLGIVTHLNENLGRYKSKLITLKHAIFGAEDDSINEGNSDDEQKKEANTNEMTKLTSSSDLNIDNNEYQNVNNDDYDDVKTSIETIKPQLNENEGNKVLNVVKNIYSTFNESNKCDENFKFNKKRHSNASYIMFVTKSKSNKYFIILFWFYISVKLWSYSLFLFAIFIIIWKLIKILIVFLKNILSTKFDINRVKAKIRTWINDREEVLAPKPFKILLELYIKGDHKINQWLQNSLDSLISAFMIFILLVFMISAFIILAIKVRNESIELITILSNIINENIYSQPYLRQLLPEKQKLNALFQDAISKLYLYGRDWLTNRLKSFISLTDEEQFKQLEKQLLSQWDLLYTYLSEKASNITSYSFNETDFNLNNALITNLAAAPSILSTTTTTVASVTSTLSPVRNLVKQHSFDLTNTWNLITSKENFNYQYLMELIKENIGILMSLSDSFYLIIKSNINILFTIVKVLLSLLFQSGFALFNFFISFIVYMTALFYLLSSSGNRYKPLKWLHEITFFKGSNNKSDLLSKAIEESISGVFMASLKMAVFYGLYTWLIHHLFDLKIAYIPAILASIFAFLPILSTYYVAFFGVLELWLHLNQPLYAFLFLLCLVLPTYIVDMAIYSDIKGKF